MNHMVIGMGEVGRAVHEVLSEGSNYVVGYHELETCELPYSGPTDVMHVCIPYSRAFEMIVKSYENVYRPQIVIVHSSVPIGTCDRNKWVHSPIRGVHPNIAKGIKTFVKCFGGEQAKSAAGVFSWLGVKTITREKARDTEAAKLWDTTQYGWQIVLCKAIHKWCEENGVDFDFVYRGANMTYNEGYEALGRKEVARPYLKHMPGPIGGHCVIPNLPLLGKNEIAEFIREFNDRLIQADLALSSEQP